MKLDQIFQAIEETKFLEQLASQKNLFFIGDSAPLKYIQNFCISQKSNNSNYYYDLTAFQLNDLSKNATNLEQYQAIIIVSLVDETALYLAVKEELKQLTSLPILRLFSDIFINLLCRRSLLQPTSQVTQKPDKSYAILTTPRSGSTYLCELLNSTKIAGHPSEHLRLAAQELSLYCNFNYLTLLDNLMTYRTSNNGVFGTKIISHFLFELKQTKPDFKQLFKSIDKFILLVRKDKLAQAVSLVVAQKTEVWHLHHNGQDKDTDYQSKLENIEISDGLLDDVEQKCNFIIRQEIRLKKLLAEHQIEPLIIVYEDILENPEQQIKIILEFLAIAQPEGYTMQINSGIKRMPSRLSQEIIRQYQQKKAASVESFPG
ncbi:MAG: Stf0 family sulfotransferase [Cyanobacteria bacterium P01_G01_bin.67]